MAQPLSPWVAAVPLDGSWDRAGQINDGDERADARWLPAFADGWRHAAVPLDLGYPALGLVRPGTDRVFVELDEVAGPIPVEPQVLAVLNRLETSWSDADLTAADLATLQTADQTLRFLLLDRLAAETAPAPGTFHILPWPLVEQLTDDVIAVLSGGEPREVIALRHWFNPAGADFTAALEQLDEGLREPSAALTRQGATAFCARLAEFDVRRLPGPLRQRLADLVGMLLDRNEFLGETARRARDRLLDGALPDTAPIQHDRELARADDHDEREVVLAPFTLHLSGLSGDVLTLTITAAVADQTWAWVIEAYGEMWLPVQIIGPNGAMRYQVPLVRGPGEIAGEIEVQLGRGGLLEVDVAGPPIGDAEAKLLPREEVRRSIEVSPSRDGLNQWRALSGRLRSGHPLREVIEEAFG